MTLLRLLTGGLVLLPLLSRPAQAQVLDLGFASPTGIYAPGTVYALGPLQADNKRLVAGIFSRVNGTAVGQLVRLDAAGALDAPFTQNVGAASNIYLIKGLANGQYLLGANGGTVAAGGLARPELLRLNANGTADATFDPGTGPSAGGFFGYGQDFAVQPDGKVVVVGYFDSFNAVPANGVVRLNANGSVDPGFGVGAGLDVATANANAVAVQPDGKLLVGGSFSAFGGQPASGLVRLTAAGGVDASFVSPFQAGSEVESLTLQPDGKVLASGFFTVNGANVQLVRLLPTGALDPGFAPVSYPSGSIATGGVVLQPDGKILVSGSFGTVTYTSNLVRLNADGTADASFQSATNSNTYPYVLGLQANGSVLVGGSFNDFNGAETPLGRLSSAGAVDPGFAPKVQAAGSILALARQATGEVVVGGSFTELNGVAVHRVARFSAAGVLDAGYSAATGVLPAPVACLALQPDGKLLAGTNRGVLRLLPSGSPDASFNFLFPFFTTALALQPDGKVLVGGSFSVSTGGASYRGLLRTTSSGGLDPTFVRPVSSATFPGAPTTTDAVLVQPDGRVVVGGGFQVAGGTAVARVVRYEPTGALDASFAAPAFTLASGASNPLNRLYALALQPDGKLLAGGNFGAVDGSPRSAVARLNPTGALDAGFAPNAALTGTVYALARQPNGRVLLGGSFTTSGPTATIGNLARVLANGQVDASFTPTAGPNSTVRALAIQPDGGIVLAGAFATVGGQPAAGVARVVAADVLHVAAPAAVAARTAAWPVPAHGWLHIAPDPSAQPLAIDLLDALGRPVRTQPATRAAEQTLSLENLPAGVYLLRVRYAAGVVTRRIAVQ